MPPQVVRKGGALTKEAISDSDIKLLFRALDKDRDGTRLLAQPSRASAGPELLPWCRQE